ncbi:MAG TPA: hypothetical protein VEV17_18910 [Bryobacteraceae bacterium]|nr:hypothetical protein [Bryobacteraceae bacterium]
MQEKPVFLQIGTQLINIAALSKVELIPNRKVANLCIGDVAIIQGSTEAYTFFTQKASGWFEVVTPTTL